MKVKTIVCSLVSFLTVSLFSAQAGTLYVSTSGSDSNPGTSAQPFRTITHAYGLAGPGTTILVLPGVYTDYTSGWGLHLGASGTASSPIVLQSQVRGGAVIDGQNASDRNVAIYIDGSYNIVEGFEIRNGPNSGITIWGNGNQILDNEIHNNGNPASTSGNGCDGVYDNEGTSGNIYAGNYIHNNGRSGGSNLDHGLYLCGNNEWVINNVVTANDSRGLQIAGYTTTSNMKVLNNVFAWNGVDGVTIWQDMNGITIENNIIYQNGRYGVQFSAATGGGVVIDHNILYGNAAGSYYFTDVSSTVSYSLGTTISSNPLFVNGASSGFNAHLGPGSPAIGAGYNLSSSFTTDLAGATRTASGTWDLGAYVYASSDTTPPTVAISSPANGATVSGTITISASASDNVGVASVQFIWDGANLGSALTSAPFSVSLNTTSKANGSHTLTAVARDAAGNQTTATTITVNVNNLSSPTIALTSPANGASYSAPATINLAASVTANGHTITQVRFYNGSTLLGSATTAPYSLAWNNVTAAIYGLSATAVYDSGSTVVTPSTTVSVTNLLASANVSFASTSGTISAPFYVTNGAIAQPAYTGVTAGGQAVYTFNISTAGHYVVSVSVNAPSQDNNSLFLNIDAQPTDPTMIWDIPLTTGFASETVSWRGNGVVSSTASSGLTAQFAPKVFNLSAGVHQLIIRGREANNQLGTITIAPTSLAAN
jgi:hypothetical protein